MILVDGVYLLNNGGLVILERLKRELVTRGLPFMVLLDDRHKPKEKTVIIKRGIFSRYKFYKKFRHKYSSVICLGNIPPPVKCNIKVFLFFHNVNLLNKNDIITRLKRVLIKAHMMNCSEVIVQTDLVAKNFATMIRAIRPIIIHPVFDKSIEWSTADRYNGSVLKLFYPASSAPHKNHLLLLKSLANYHGEYELVLTLDSLPTRLLGDLSSQVNIVYLGSCNRDKIFSTISEVDALIFPSLTESFGLPLVEAATMKKPILAIDLPYVDEIISTPYRFDNNIHSLIKCIRKLVRDMPNATPATLLVEDETHKIINKLSI